MFNGARVHAVESIYVFYSCRNDEQDRRGMWGVLKYACNGDYSILQETNEEPETCPRSMGRSMQAEGLGWSQGCRECVFKVNLTEWYSRLNLLTQLTLPYCPLLILIMLSSRRKKQTLLNSYGKDDWLCSLGCLRECSEVRDEKLMG